MSPGFPTPPPAVPPAYSPVDTQELTTWEPRTPVDRLSVRLAAGVRAHWVKIALAYLAFAVLANATGILADLASVPGLGLAFGTMVAVSLVPFVALIAWVWTQDRTTKEPIPTLLMTFALGAVIAEVSRAGNTSFGDYFLLFGPALGVALSMFLVTGPIEEVSKWLAVRVYAYRRPEFNDVIDGAIYGIAAGAGFAWWENWTYIYQGIVDGVYETGTLAGGLEWGWTIVIIRGIGFLAHPVWAGISGYYLGLAKHNPEHRASLIAKGLLIPSLMHGASNTYLMTLGYVSEDSGAILGLILLDYLFIFGCAAFLFRKMRRNNAYTLAMGRPLPSSGFPGAGADSVSFFPGAPGIERLDAARDHVAGIRTAAERDGDAAWMAWADATAERLQDARAAFARSPRPEAAARLERWLQASVLPVAYPVAPEPVAESV